MSSETGKMEKKRVLTPKFYGIRQETVIISLFLKHANNPLVAIPALV